jgi:hypothetical protein
MPLWDGTMIGGVRVYQAADYRVAFVSLIAWTAMGLVASLFCAKPTAGLPKSRRIRRVMRQPDALLSASLVQGELA